MRENPPLMVLDRETKDRITFRFRGNRWAVATLLPGLVLVAVVLRLAGTGNPAYVLQAVIGGFGVLLIYSSIYSATATQWLTADGKTKTIAFHKKNLYGLVDWVRPGSDFKAVKVWKHRKASNWSITLVCGDDAELHVGENAFGAFGYEKAVSLAQKISTRTGVPVALPVPPGPAAG